MKIAKMVDADELAMLVMGHHLVLLHDDSESPEKVFDASRSLLRALNWSLQAERVGLRLGGCDSAFRTSAKRNDLNK